MASTDVKNVETVILKYRALDANDKLAVLAQLYGEVSAELAPTFSQSNITDDAATNLVKQIQELSSEQQVDALRNLVAGKQSKGETEYESLGTDSKLFFWFQLAQNLGKSIVGVPDDYIPNEQVSEVLDLIGTPKVEDLVSLLKQAL